MDTVESRYNGPGSNANLPITEAIFKSFFIFCIGNNRNQPVTIFICYSITDKNGWSLEIRKSGS